MSPRGTNVRANTVPAWPVQFARNLKAGIQSLTRAPPTGSTTPAWPTHSRLVWGTVIVIGLVGSVMVIVDAWSLDRVRSIPGWLLPISRVITDLGLSSWWLIPMGVILLLIAAVSSPRQSRYVSDALAVLSVRIGFLFAAIAVPGLTIAIVKRIIGRARPFVGGENPFLYEWMVWRADYASFPSGHATTAFAAAVGVGALFPRLRPLMWTYAVLVALSRVVVTAHHPSDVIAGAICGTVGALLVRHWFARRRLGFAVAPDGSIHPLRMPSWARVKSVAQRLLSA